MAEPGEGPAGPSPPLIFRQNGGPKGRKNFFGDPPFLRVCMIAPPPLISRSVSGTALLSRLWAVSLFSYSPSSKTRETRKWTRFAAPRRSRARALRSIHAKKEKDCSPSVTVISSYFAMEITYCEIHVLRCKNKQPWKE